MQRILLSSAQFGISLDSTFTPISEFSSAWDQPKGNTTRMSAKIRGRIVTGQGVQCHSPRWDGDSTHMAQQGPSSPPAMQEQPQEHWLSSSIGN